MLEAEKSLYIPETMKGLLCPEREVRHIQTCMILTER